MNNIKQLVKVLFIVSLSSVALISSVNAKDNVVDKFDDCTLGLEKYKQKLQTSNKAETNKFGTLIAESTHPKLAGSGFNHIFQGWANDVEPDLLILETAVIKEGNKDYFMRVVYPQNLREQVVQETNLLAEILILNIDSKKQTINEELLFGDCMLESLNVSYKMTEDSILFLEHRYQTEQQ
ncbi:hypothetical protein [Thalassotalea crassostreae]|uniref:hypothetical protein n=1 Tax=Thalassotalea crassostreae TaxID=1763536 RepID=UPI00083943A9|nr:hypothetical protein [Thalassotalea crassostreae]